MQVKFSLSSVEAQRHFSCAENPLRDMSVHVAGGLHEVRQWREIIPSNVTHLHTFTGNSITNVSNLYGGGRVKLTESQPTILHVHFQICLYQFIVSQI